MPPVTSIYIQLQDKFNLIGYQIIAKEPNLISDMLCAILSVPEYGCGLLPSLCVFPDIIYSMCKTISFRLVCPEKGLGKDCPVNI